MQVAEYPLYIVDGLPIAWMRPGKNGKISYDPQKEEKALFQLLVNRQRKNHDVLHGPLALHIDFFMPIYKSTAQSHAPGSPHYHRPDISNLIKFVEDACNGLLYVDDACIATIKARKLYDIQPRTEFSVRPL